MFFEHFKYIRGRNNLSGEVAHKWGLGRWCISGEVGQWLALRTSSGWWFESDYEYPWSIRVKWGVAHCSKVSDELSMDYTSLLDIWIVPLITAPLITVKLCTLYNSCFGKYECQYYRIWTYLPIANKEYCFQASFGSREEPWEDEKRSSENHSWYLQEKVGFYFHPLSVI